MGAGEGRAPDAAPLRLWFRLRIAGAEHIPAEGAAIIAPNHKSFMDVFFLALGTRRHVRYMAKRELFRGPLAWLFPRLGAFPVWRGEADEHALETARAILDQGGLLVVFPEGTRVDEPDALGSPHHGAGRLALESGAPIVPAAVAGTHHLWLGPIHKPRRVGVAFGTPIEASELGDSPAALTELIDGRVWPASRPSTAGFARRRGSSPRRWRLSEWAPSWLGGSGSGPGHACSASSRPRSSAVARHAAGCGERSVGRFAAAPRRRPRPLGECALWPAGSTWISTTFCWGSVGRASAVTC